MTYHSRLARILSAIFLSITFAGPGQADADLSLGEEIGGIVAIGQTYTREVHGDWKIRCIRTQSRNDPCQLYQLMLDGAGNSVAEISLFDVPQGGGAVAGATIAAPLQTLLTEQLTLSVDAGNTKRYPFSYCTQQGCYARIGLTAEDLESFEKGTAATVVIVPVAAPDTRIGLSLSLIGFTDGFAAVKASNAALAEQ